MDLSSFIVTDAINYGIEEAVFLWHLKKIIKKCYYEARNMYAGEIWIPLDIWELKFAFPFWTQTKIKKTLKSLVDKQVIKKKRLYALRREHSYALANQNDLE